MAEEPERIEGGETAYAAAYLRFYRDTIVAKCRALPDPELRRPRLPSGWTPLELLVHVTYVERRWFVWGFLGEQVPDPWGDHVGGEPDGRWLVPAGTALDDVVAMLEATAARTETVLAEHGPEELAALGGRFESDPPTLRWICFHVLQEYARHAGHLDVVVELAGGPTGE
ncbi:DinB family protein [Nocardioides sp. KR10-350]|uniref:DinB family protein n=1 Tax=Nocardioides cheoyonin TaxID=3156615 RepID=UPI0032B454CE